MTPGFIADTLVFHRLNYKRPETALKFHISVHCSWSERQKHQMWVNGAVCGHFINPPNEYYFIQHTNYFYTLLITYYYLLLNTAHVINPKNSENATISIFYHLDQRKGSQDGWRVSLWRAQRVNSFCHMDTHSSPNSWKRLGNTFKGCSAAPQWPKYS